VDVEHIANVQDGALDLLVAALVHGAAVINKLSKKLWVESVGIALSQGAHYLDLD